MKLTRTQCMALTHLHHSMKDFLFNYAEGRLDVEFFINGMSGLIDEIDTLVRENGDYNCSYSRALEIDNNLKRMQSNLKAKVFIYAQKMEDDSVGIEFFNTSMAASDEAFGDKRRFRDDISSHELEFDKDGKLVQEGFL